MRLTTNKDVGITALLCSHDSAFEGANQSYQIKANKPHDITLRYRFKENTPVVKFQLNVSDAPEKPVNFQIEDLLIVEYP
jgi:hypothetical protein